MLDDDMVMVYGLSPDSSISSNGTAVSTIASVTSNATAISVISISIRISFRFSISRSLTAVSPVSTVASVTSQTVSTITSDAKAVSTIPTTITYDATTVTTITTSISTIAVPGISISGYHSGTDKTKYENTLHFD